MWLQREDEEEDWLTGEGFTYLRTEEEGATEPKTGQPLAVGPGEEWILPCSIKKEPTLPTSVAWVEF